jgi:hypothetical protein
MWSTAVGLAACTPAPDILTAADLRKATVQQLAASAMLFSYPTLRLTHPEYQSLALM